MTVEVKCQQCSTIMHKEFIYKEKNRSSNLLGAVIIICLCIIVFPIGLMLLALVIVAKIIAMIFKLNKIKQNIWKCPNCGYFFEAIGQ